MEDACKEEEEKEKNCAYRAGVTKHRRNDERRQNKEPDRIIWPLPPDSADERFEMEVCARFMRYLRYAPGYHPEIKILSSIHFVADLLDCCDAHIAKILVERGLRAPRAAFPSCFLEFADGALKSSHEGIDALIPGLRDLKSHWEKIGEDRRFNHFEYIHTLIIQGDICTHA